MSDLIVTRKFKEYRFTTKQIEKEDKEDGFVEVEVTDEMMEDIGINEEFKQEVVNGKKQSVVLKMSNALLGVNMTWTVYAPSATSPFAMTAGRLLSGMKSFLKL